MTVTKVPASAWNDFARHLVAANKSPFTVEETANLLPHICAVEELTACAADVRTYAIAVMIAGRAIAAGHTWRFHVNTRTEKPPERWVNRKWSILHA